ncbi:MAG: TetR family transcriptional regulator [Pseudomonadota bacterium]
MPEITTRLPTEARQAEIAATLIALAGERSPGAITTTELAGALGLSQGALFKHFPTKDAIWLAAIERVQAELLQRLREAADAAPTPLQGLQAVFLAHARYLADQPGVPRLIFHELQRPDDSEVKQRVRALLQAYRALVGQLIAQAVAQRELPAALDKEAAATLFLGAIQGLVMQSMLAGKPRAVLKLAERVVSVLFAAWRP